MKTKLILIAFVLMTMYNYIAKAQQSYNSTIDSLNGFNEAAERTYFLAHHSNPNDYDEYIIARKREFIFDKFYPSNKTISPPPTTQAACSNVDFENGTTNGWTLSTGYNPVYNAAGCCNTTGGAQTITSGTVLDGCGGFPVVAPGGNYSLMLGNNLVGGVADRIEQTFTVTQSNSIFIYKYAVVLQDPGHAPADQPSFQIDMVDSNGVQIPCTFYQVSAGQGIPGFQNSTSCPSVIYKPWTTVAVNLSNYINQNVTIRFTTYDCALGGHYAYAYIDGSCMNYRIIRGDSLCVGSTAQLCAPAGFASYTWNGPNVNNQSGQCISVNSAGDYSVQVSTVTGCTAPTLSVHVNSYPTPTAHFNVGVSNNVCDLNVTFHNTSSMSGGSATDYFWDFGDGGTSTLQSPIHTYIGYGTYTVSLIVTAPTGCADTAIQVITLNPAPSPTFTVGTACTGSPTTFTNTTTATTQWLWDFGDGNTSTLENPTNTYASAGTYNVIFTAITANGCTTSVTIPVIINPLPNVAFTASSVCQGTNTVFSNTSTISSGSISGWQWDFNTDGTIDDLTQNPTYIFPNAGVYMVTLTAGSNQNCYNSYNSQVTVYPNPVAAFSVPNNCPGVPSAFSNSSGIQAPSIITSYYWDFGNNSNSTLQTPAYTYSNAGIYNVSLTASSNQGCSTTYNSSITIYPLPNVNFISSVACYNSQTQFTNQSSISSGSISTWEWDFDNNGTVDATITNPSYIYPTAGMFNCKLKATSNFSCASSITHQTIVNFKPVAAFTAQSVCLGANTTFTDGSIVNGSSINNWAWDFDSNGTIDNINQNPTYAYQTAGNYNVNLTVTSAQGCTATYTTQVNVYPNPVPAFNSSGTCEGVSSAFFNTSSIPSPESITVYLWNFGNDGNSTLSNPTFTFAGTGNYIVTLNATSNHGCTATYNANITINPAPIVSFNADPVCYNQPTSLTDQSTISSGTIVTWAWDFDNNGSVDASVPNPTFVYPSAGIFNCNLKATSNNGCSASNTLSVTVFANPVAAFGTQSVCLNKPMNFTDHSTSSVGDITVWNWDFNSDGVVDNISQNPSFTYTTTGTFLVTLEVQTSNGCVTTIQKSVRVNPNPVVSFSVPTHQGCPELCINFTNNTTITGGTVANWLWNFGDNSVPSLLQNPHHCFGSGQFNISLTAISDSGCIGTYTATNAINVFPAPTADFVVSPDNADAPDVIDPLVNIIDQSHGANSFHYYISDGTSSSQENFSHEFSNENEGNYMITQIVSNTYGCKDTISKPVEIKPAYTFYIPNAFTPNDDGKNEIFKGEGIGIQEYNMWIFDRWGNMIFYTNELDRGWDGKFQGKSDNTVMQDVFVWKVELKDIFNKKHDFKGTVAVVR